MNATTGRLTLRPARLEDLDDLARVSSDPAVMRFSLYGPIDRASSRSSNPRTSVPSASPKSPG